jgi:hypothetical protein
MGLPSPLPARLLAQLLFDSTTVHGPLALACHFVEPRFNVAQSPRATLISDFYWGRKLALRDPSFDGVTRTA